MSGLSLSSRLSLPTPVARPERAARPMTPPAPAALSSAEEAQIARAFPERPAVAQRLYGPGAGVHTPAVLGTRLDLSA